MNTITDPFLRTKAPRSYTTPVDVDMLEITNDPCTASRSASSKYDELFAQVKPGQAIKCESQHTAKVSTALKNWISRRGLFNLKVASNSHYHKDGKGRVWLLQKDEDSNQKPIPSPKKRNSVE